MRSFSVFVVLLVATSISTALPSLVLPESDLVRLARAVKQPPGTVSVGGMTVYPKCFRCCIKGPNHCTTCCFNSG